MGCKVTDNAAKDPEYAKESGDMCPGECEWMCKKCGQKVICPHWYSDAPAFKVPYPAVHLNQPTGKIVPGHVNAEFENGTLKVEAEFDLTSTDYTTLRREIGFHMTKLGMGLGVINDKKN